MYNTFFEVHEVKEAVTMMRCSYKAEDDDFYCWKYQIWYPSIDCAYRVKFKTFQGCLNCNQGRLNLETHRWNLRKAKWPFTK